MKFLDAEPFKKFRPTFEKVLLCSEVANVLCFNGLTTTSFIIQAVDARLVDPVARSPSLGGATTTHAG
jgi:hypothetical protein